MMVDESTDKLKNKLQELLDEKFGDEFEFGPIIVRPRYDHDGDRYLHIYIVFDGDQKKLDPRWTLGLYRELSPIAEELGFSSVVGRSWVEKSEWPEVEEHLIMEEVLP